MNSFQAAQSFCCSGMCVSSFKVACVFAGDTDTEQLPSSGGQLWVWRMRSGLRCSYMWGSVTLPMQTSQAANCHCEFVSGRPILLLQWHVCFQFQSCLRFCRWHWHRTTAIVHQVRVGLGFSPIVSLEFVQNLRQSLFGVVPHMLGDSTHFRKHLPRFLISLNRLGTSPPSSVLNFCCRPGSVQGIYWGSTVSHCMWSEL